jgi:hypothetical protein
VKCASRLLTCTVSMELRASHALLARSRTRTVRAALRARRMALRSCRPTVPPACSVHLDRSPMPHARRACRATPSIMIRFGTAMTVLSASAATQGQRPTRSAHRAYSAWGHFPPPVINVCHALVEASLPPPRRPSTALRAHSWAPNTFLPPGVLVLSVAMANSATQ